MQKKKYLPKKKELLKAGFGFEEMKNMLDQDVSFKKIAETLSKTLEKTSIQPEIKDLEMGRRSGSFVEKLGKNESDQKKSFVERMRNDKTQGKSMTGASEI